MRCLYQVLFCETACLIEYGFECAFGDVAAIHGKRELERFAIRAGRNELRFRVVAASGLERVA